MCVTTGSYTCPRRGSSSAVPRDLSWWRVVTRPRRFGVSSSSSFSLHLFVRGRAPCRGTCMVCAARWSVPFSPVCFLSFFLSCLPRGAHAWRPATRRPRPRPPRCARTCNQTTKKKKKKKKNNNVPRAAVVMNNRERCCGGRSRRLWRRRRAVQREHDIAWSGLDGGADATTSDDTRR